MIRGFILIFLLISIHCKSQIGQGYRLNACSDSISSKKKSRFFILGENHWMKGNTEIAFDLFKKLYYTDSVRVFVFERGFGEIYLIDRLINKNDSSVCTLFIDKYFKKLYDLLYHFNQSLKKEDRIHLIGVDEESYNDYSFLSTYLLLQEQSSKSEEMRTLFLNYKKKYDTNNNLLQLEEIRFIQGLLLSDPAKYKALISEDVYYKLNKTFDSYFFKTKGDLNNLKDTSLITDRNLRENFMYNNLVEYNNLNRGTRYFGYFGKLHISLSNTGWLGQKQWESMAYKLNNSPDFKDKIASYQIIYMYSSILFSNFNKSRSYYNYNKRYLAEDILKKIRDKYYKTDCRYIILDTRNYIEEKNFDFIILNNFRQ